MNGFVPRQTFGSKTSHSTNDRIGVFGNSIFNDDMKDRMDLQVWQLDTGAAMVFFGELNSRLFIERKPLLWVWCLVWVVTVHDADSEANQGSGLATQHSHRPASLSYSLTLLFTSSLSESER